MTRRVAAIVLALGLCSAPLYAQDLVLRVSVSSADVHKGPSVVTPVIGHLPRGTAVVVLRNLGSWIRIEWPGAPDGFGYLHVTTGRLTPRSSDGSISNEAMRAPSAAAPVSSAPSSPASPTAGQTAIAPRPRRERVVVQSEQDGTPISHVVGFGGLFDSMRSIGATTRAWRDNRLGLQIGFTRDAMTSSVAAGRIISMQVEPAVVYGLFDHVSDYFWIRPYIGSGLSIRHQNLHDATSAGADAAHTDVGFRVFSGAEATFAGAPRFALSVDLGYRRLPTPFRGFEQDRFSASVSGHWYVK
jgi:hypothetical protein